jgi:hypothetical protein
MLVGKMNRREATSKDFHGVGALEQQSFKQKQIQSLCQHLTLVLVAGLLEILHGHPVAERTKRSGALVDARANALGQIAGNLISRTIIICKTVNSRGRGRGGRRSN